MMKAFAESCIGQVIGYFVFVYHVLAFLAAFYALQRVPFAETMQTRLLR